MGGFCAVGGGVGDGKGGCGGFGGAGVLERWGRTVLQLGVLSIEL